MSSHFFAITATNTAINIPVDEIAKLIYVNYFYINVDQYKGHVHSKGDKDQR